MKIQSRFLVLALLSLIAFGCSSSPKQYGMSPEEQALRERFSQQSAKYEMPQDQYVAQDAQQASYNSAYGNRKASSRIK